MEHLAPVRAACGGANDKHHQDQKPHGFWDLVHAQVGHKSLNAILSDSNWIKFASRKFRCLGTPNARL